MHIAKFLCLTSVSERGACGQGQGSFRRRLRSSRCQAHQVCYRRRDLSEWVNAKKGLRSEYRCLIRCERKKRCCGSAVASVWIRFQLFFSQCRFRTGSRKPNQCGGFEVTKKHSYEGTQPFWKAGNHVDQLILVNFHAFGSNPQHWIKGCKPFRFWSDLDLCPGMGRSWIRVDLLVLWQKCLSVSVLQKLIFSHV